MEKLEIEKRYLIKRLPQKINWDEIQFIHQYYSKNGRFRMIESKKGVTFIKTLKKTISEGVNKEIETEITAKQYIKEIKSATKKIHKTRYIKKVGKLKWEVDVFDKLAIAEIELPTEKDLKTVKIPKFIKDVLILDVTPIKAFSNFNIADVIKKK